MVGVRLRAWASMRAADLDVERLGEGPPIVLVHGSIVGAERTWRAAARAGRRAGRCSCRTAPASAPAAAAARRLRGRGAADRRAAGRRRASRRPLLRRGDRAVRGGAAPAGGSLADGLRAGRAARRGRRSARSTRRSRTASGSTATARELEPRDFVRLFRSGVGSAHATPESCPTWLARGAAHVMARAPAMGGELAARRSCAAAAFPKLVDLGRPLARLRDRLRRARGAHRRRARDGVGPRPLDPGRRRALQRAAGGLPQRAVALVQQAQPVRVRRSSTSSISSVYGHDRARRGRRSRSSPSPGPAPRAGAARSRRPGRRSRRRRRSGSRRRSSCRSPSAAARGRSSAARRRVRSAPPSRSRRPGAITPPRYSPSAETGSNVIAVPKSTTTHASPTLS